MTARRLARKGLWLVTLLALCNGLPVRAAPQPEVQRLWAAQCAYCHATGVAPRLDGRALPPQLVVQIVRKGGVQMPAFTPSAISPAELEQLARWVQTMPEKERQP